MRTENVKPSVLLKDALLALEECERSKNYTIGMNVWHLPNYINGGDGSKCTVCLAGSVMAKRLHQNKNLCAEPMDFSSDVYGKLQALNDLRLGRIDAALYDLGIDVENYQLPHAIEVTPYHVSPKEWKDDMELLGEVLEDEGL